MILKVLKARLGRTAICKCDWCKKEFRERLSHANNSQLQFCSRSCYDKAQSDIKTGKKLPKEWIENIRKSKLGKNNPMFGFKYSKEQRKLRSLKAGSKRKETKSSYRNTADIFWSRIIRFKNRCEICGETSSLQSHHIIGRRNLTLRWDLKNGICLCAGCHRFRNQSVHQDPIWFSEWLKVNKKEVYNYLITRRNVISKYTIEDYKKIINDLRDCDPNLNN